MTPPFIRRIVGFYVFLLVFALGPGAQQKFVQEGATSLIEAPAPGAVLTRQGLSVTAGESDAAGTREDCSDAAVVEELKAAGVRILQAAGAWPGGLFAGLPERPAGSG